MARQNFDLEQRLLDYSARIIRLVESRPNTQKLLQTMRVANVIK